MEKRCLIDWLRFTFSDLAIMQDFCEAFALAQQPGTPTGFYNSAITLSSGGVRVGDVCWHTTEPRQRVQFTFTGRDLDHWRAADTIGALMAYVVLMGGRFTRIDVAIDILDSPSVLAETLARDAELGHMTTHAKTMSVIRGVRDGIKGTTLYVGNRQSEKFLRVYDKAAEQGIPGLLWTRIELEMKGDYARAVGPRIAEEGMDLARAEIDRFVSFDYEWWHLAVGAGATYAKIDVNRTPGDRLLWQNTTLLTMAKEACKENTGFRALLVNYLKANRYID